MYLRLLSETLCSGHSANQLVYEPIQSTTVPPEVQGEGSFAVGFGQLTGKSIFTTLLP